MYVVTVWACPTDLRFHWLRGSAIRLARTFLSHYLGRSRERSGRGARRPARESDTPTLDILLSSYPGATRSRANMTEIALPLAQQSQQVRSGPSYRGTATVTARTWGMGPGQVSSGPQNILLLGNSNSVTVPKANPYFPAPLRAVTQELTMHVISRCEHKEALHECGEKIQLVTYMVVGNTGHSKCDGSVWDMDLIDILWKQDIDLGVGREVFDYQQRQKEYELEKQKKLEKERLEKLQKEQEKAFYTQLQLDEETGEFIPNQQAPPVEAAAAIQTLTSSLQNKDDLGTEAGLSSDDFMKLLTDTFPFEPSNMAYQAWVPNAPIEDSHNFLYPGPNSEPVSLQNPVADGENIQEMEQAWEELMSIAELKCLNNELENMVDLSMYPTPECTPVPETANGYGFLNSLPALDKPMNTMATFSNDLGDSFAPHIPEVDTKSSFNLDSFCDDILTLIDPKSLTNDVPLEDSSRQCLKELLNEPIDIAPLSLCKAFSGNNPSEFNDSDSGISVNTSPCATSPGQSMTSSLYGDAQFGYSDSEMDDVENTPESVQTITPEKYKSTISEDAFFSLSPFIPQDMNAFEMDMLNSPSTDQPVSPGHTKSPFAKDKSLSRLEARFTRDEQRAKALNIPFSVEKIVNLPVEDFNLLMSKHQFNEAQLALIRDIRRRGKNKVAAQNCRKRKMENIVELETDLDKLKYEKEKLLAEKGEYNSSLLQLKKQIGSLYMEVFSKLRDEEGKPYSSQEYSLQQTKDGNVFLVPKSKKLEIKKE
ncbi:nuclear factor erythroid 2-related factor 2 [Pelodytes ibericus]